MRKPGLEFEERVHSILRLLPAARLNRNVRIAGKDVDILCEIDRPLGGRDLIAIECKDYSRPLTREEVVGFVSDYLPLLSNDGVTGCYLVTRSGIVANAKAALTVREMLHLTFEELLNLVLRPAQLLSNMEQRFRAEQLSEYYVDTRAYDIDIGWLSKHFGLAYGDFLEFGLQTGFTFERAVTEWKKSTKDTPDESEPIKYDEKTYNRIIRERTATTTSLLEPTVMSWLMDKAIKEGLAVIGSYGTGKSCFAKCLAARCATKFSAGEVDRIPFLIELKDLGQHQDIRGLVVNEIVNGHRLNWSFETFQTLNDQGRLLLILDGFDEMKHGLTRDAILYNFDQINSLHSSSSKVLICGRPTAFSSDSEQQAILSGSARSGLSNELGYIQIRVAPFSPADSLSFLRRYYAVRERTSYRSVSGKLDILESVISTDYRVRELLSRPVHLPMLAAILPDITPSSHELSRAKVYGRFIEKIIRREVFRRGTALITYSITERQTFAEELALLMLGQGESRAVSASEIPNELIAGLGGDDRSLEERRADLVGACFLERKPSNILFFPHKSFAEYLAAKALVRRLEQRHPETDISADAITDEVFSFLLEVTTRGHWRAALLWPVDNIRLITKAASTLQLPEITKRAVQGVDELEAAFLDADVVRRLSAEVLRYPEILAFHLVRLWGGALANRLDERGRSCVARACDQLKTLNVGAVGTLASRYGSKG